MSCVICFASLFQDDPVSAITPCGHVFHTDCLRQNSLSSITKPRCRTCRTQFDFPASLVRIFLTAPIVDDEQRPVKMENERMSERIVDLEVKLKRLEKDNEEREKRVNKLNMEQFYLQNAHQEVVEERNVLKERLDDMESPKEIQLPVKKEAFRRSFSVRLKNAFRSKKVTQL